MINHVWFHLRAYLCRLGGIPMGVIAVETRAVEVVIPADPGNPDSEAKVDALNSALYIWLIDHHVVWIWWQQGCKHVSRIRLFVPSWPGESLVSFCTIEEAGRSVFSYEWLVKELISPKLDVFFFSPIRFRS